MADSITLNAMSGGSVVDTEVPTFRGNHIQRMKIAVGAVDSDAGDATSTNPLPVLITNPTVSGSPTTVSGQQHVMVDNIPTYQFVKLADANGNIIGLAAAPVYTSTVSGSKTDIQNFPTVQTVNVQNLPPLTTISGSQTDIKNFPTYQGVRLFDIAGNYFGVPTNPVTISGLMDMEGWLSVTYSGQTNGKQVVRATAGKFGGYYYYNPNSSVAYIQVFDALQASDVTLGTTDPKATYGVPATSGANVELTRGLKIQNGIVIAVTTTAKGSTAPTTGLDLTIYHKT